ncbi:MAG: CdaR family protein [Vulcanimicrobiota bacterium]
MRNPGLREAIALTLAVILWLYVRVVAKSGVTGQETQVQLKVPIQIRGQNPKLTLYEMSHDEVEVTVQGDSQDVTQLRGDLITASVDLTGEEANSIYPAVKVLVPGGLRTIAIKPETINIRQAAIISKQVPFHLTVSGTAAKGRNAGKPVFTPKTASVSGPEPLVNEVSEVRGRILLTGESQTTSYEVRDLDPVNGDGQKVEGSMARLKVNPGRLTVTVPVEAENRSVAVAVSLDRIRVEHADGWRPVIEVEPAFVTLSLTKDQQAPDYVPTRSEVFAASTRVESRDVPLEIPDGFEVIGERSVRVRVVPTRTPPPATPLPEVSPRPKASPTPK